MESDCKWINDVECPYARGHQDCNECDKYEEDTRKHPLDDSDKGDYLYEQEKDRRMWL